MANIWTVLRRTPSSCASILLLGGITIAPFLPAVVAVLRGGVADPLQTGDAASLELGVMSAITSVRFLGPYSRFGWSHPGPAYFYLAAPIYALFDHRSAALRVFALTVNVLSASLVVGLAARLKGTLFAVIVASLLTVYELVAVPYLIGNEWNPILPLLPAIGLFFTGVWCVLSSSSTALVVLVGLASAIVQTHIGFAPYACTIGAFVGYHTWRRSVEGVKPPWVALTATLGALWALPLFEAVQHPFDGNFQRLVSFFVTARTPDHSWREAAAVLLPQIGVLPVAVTNGLTTWGGDGHLVGGLVLAAVVWVNWRFRNRDQTQASSVMLRMAGAEAVVAIWAVRSIQGNFEPYLIIGSSVVGFVVATALAAWLFDHLARPGPAGRLISLLTTCGCVTLIILCVARRPSAHMSPSRNSEAERLVHSVGVALSSRHIERVNLRFHPGEVWPTAAAVVLSLAKAGTHVSVDPQWRAVMADPNGATLPSEDTLLLLSGRLCEEPPNQKGFIEIGRNLQVCARLGR